MWVDSNTLQLNGHCYILRWFAKLASFTVAHCNALSGGYPIKIETQKEFDLIGKMVTFGVNVNNGDWVNQVFCSPAWVSFINDYKNKYY